MVELVDEKDCKIKYSKIIKYSRIGYTDRQLLDFLIQFSQREKRTPARRDFIDNPEYPNYQIYRKRFGSWSNALKLVDLDVESMIKNGVIKTSDQKARLSELIVIRHFEKHPVDLAGENRNSSCDGICPNGKTYDVKCSKLLEKKGWLHYWFNIKNKHKDMIEIYYLLAFNEDYTKLNYIWRVPGEIIEKDYFVVGTNYAEFNIHNMERYNITNKFREILTEYKITIENI